MKNPQKRNKFSFSLQPASSVMLNSGVLRIPDSRITGTFKKIRALPGILSAIVVKLSRETKKKLYLLFRLLVVPVSRFGIFIIRNAYKWIEHANHATLYREG